MERIFLGWNSACLPAAAAWLVDTFACDGDLNLADVILVTPGRRAGRRLLELLATGPTPLDGLSPAGSPNHASDATSSPAPTARLQSPPTILTVGQLADRLCPPQQHIASDLTSLLARMASMRQADPQTLETIVPHPPADDDLLGWRRLAADLASLADELAAALVPIDDVSTRIGELPDAPSDDRWQAVASLDRDYHQRLTDMGLVDKNAVIQQAMADGLTPIDQPVILIGVAELSPLIRAILQAAADDVRALIHAPANEAAAFDAFGCLRVSAWADRTLDIDEAIVQVVDRPRDQAMAVAAALALPPADPSASANAAMAAGAWRAEAITIGVADDALQPIVERAIQLAGAPVRTATGREVAKSAPALLMQAAADYLETRRFESLAAIMRHPDFEPRVRAAFTSPVERSLLTLLDQYLARRLQIRVSDHWLGDSDEVQLLHDFGSAIVLILPPDPQQRRTLSAWAGEIATWLSRMYADIELDRRRPSEAAALGAFDVIANILRNAIQFGDDESVCPPMTLPQALRFVIAEIGMQAVAPEGGPPTIEILGWLELQLDDAPMLIITGVNEGAAPQSVNADAFLPDRLRRMLGLNDNANRYARDLYMLTAMQASRPTLKLITGRRSAAGDPLTPSRLLLACDPETLARRITSFYRDDPLPPTLRPLLKVGGESQFLMPPPLPPDEPITSLYVTAFRDYLACPYRFYLRWVRNLRALDDRVYELDGAAFGNLAHDALSDFAIGASADSTSAQEIEAALLGALDRRVRRTYGEDPTLVIRIQQEQLAYRLRAFAQWQADQRRDGWTILAERTEGRMRAQLDVDGQPFEIIGRVDRIDRHEQTGRYRIMDYKTSDTKRDPDKQHREVIDEESHWTDLQLPLYRRLAAGVTVGDHLSNHVELGYVALPKKVGETGFYPADWSADELASAFATAEQVIRQIRRGIFWPPSDPPAYADDYTRLCQDENIARTQVIQRVTAGISNGEDA